MDELNPLCECECGKQVACPIFYKISDMERGYKEIREIWEHVFPDRKWEAGPDHQRATTLLIHLALVNKGLREACGYSGDLDTSRELLMDTAVFLELHGCETRAAALRTKARIQAAALAEA